MIFGIKTFVLYVIIITIKTYVEVYGYMIAMTLLGKRVMLVDDEPGTLTVLNGFRIMACRR